MSKVGLPALTSELAHFDSTLFLLEFNANRFDPKFLDVKIIKPLDSADGELITPVENYVCKNRKFYKCFKNDTKIKFGVFFLHKDGTLSFQKAFTDQISTEIVQGTYGPYISYSFKNETHNSMSMLAPSISALL